MEPKSNRARVKWPDARRERDKRRIVFGRLDSVPIDEKRQCYTADQLYEDLQIRGYKQAAKRAYWRAVVDAARRAVDCTGCVRYSRDSVGSFYLRLQVVEAAVSAGWFEDYRSLKGGNKMSRLIPTKKLADWLGGVPSKSGPPVKLRQPGEKEDLPFDPEHPVAKHAAEVLDRMNEVIGGWDWGHMADIRVKVEDVWGKVQTRQLTPQHFAIFHSPEFDRHGRIYTGRGGHQTLSKLERSTITFCGRPSVELDYSAFHPNMLYDLDGLRLDGDPYMLFGPKTTKDQRQVSKIIVNAAINAPTRKAAISALHFKLTTRGKCGKEIDQARLTKRVLDRAGVTMTQLLERAEEMHSPIAKHFNSGAGKRLMTIDGKIALAVLDHFGRRGCPCLAVHDSFIVPAEQGEDLRQVMESEYRKVTGRSPRITG